MREADLQAKLAAFSSWDPINYGIIESNLQVHKETGIDLGPSSDESDFGGDEALLSLDRTYRKEKQMAEAAAAYIHENPDLKLMYVQFDLPDSGGHSKGYNTSKQLKTIGQTDSNTGIILEAIDHAGLLEESLIIFISDHGGGGVDPKSHGSDHRMDKTIFWGCSNTGWLNAPHLPPDFVITDTAALAVHALGLEAPEAWEAKLPARM
ncbi:alkaline phosphatase family protein [Paenibacillus solisilvae]|uniref:Alkaline phosphatase family protein n=1 Tax=Paenibacillus solisilvae TaxID=2486751 RepID=A0ABW0VT37_9BACL